MYDGDVTLYYNHIYNICFVNAYNTMANNDIIVDIHIYDAYNSITNIPYIPGIIYLYIVIVLLKK